MRIHTNIVKRVAIFLLSFEYGCIAHKKGILINFVCGFICIIFIFNGPIFGSDYSTSAISTSDVNFERVRNSFKLILIFVLLGLAFLCLWIWFRNIIKNFNSTTNSGQTTNQVSLLSQLLFFFHPLCTMFEICFLLAFDFDWNRFIKRNCVRLDKVNKFVPFVLSFFFQSICFGWTYKFRNCTMSYGKWRYSLLGRAQISIDLEKNWKSYKCCIEHLSNGFRFQFSIIDTTDESKHRFMIMCSGVIHFGWNSFVHLVLSISTFDSLNCFHDIFSILILLLFSVRSCVSIFFKYSRYETDEVKKLEKKTEKPKKTISNSELMAIDGPFSVLLHFKWKQLKSRKQNTFFFYFAVVVKFQFKNREHCRIIMKKNFLQHFIQSKISFYQLHFFFALSRVFTLTFLFSMN